MKTCRVRSAPHEATLVWIEHESLIVRITIGIQWVEDLATDGGRGKMAELVGKVTSYEVKDSNIRVLSSLTLVFNI